MSFICNFAVLEGGDGSGTTTQMSFLTEKYKNTKQQPVFATFEPTDGKIGCLIRSALKKEIDIRPQTLCHLFASDRNEHLFGKGGILERAGKGEFVLCDRYVLSSLVYQGIECGDDLPQMLNSRFPLPERTIFLEIKPEIALERMKNRTSHDIFENLDFQKKVYEKYMEKLELYKNWGAHVETVDASKSQKEVADQIWSIISKMPIFNQ